MSKVMIIGNSIDGFYSFRKELASELKARGHEAVLVFPAGDRMAYFAERGYKVVVAEMERHGTDPIQELRLCHTLYRILRAERPNVVLTYTIKPNIYAGLICRALRIPYIANITGLGTALNGRGTKRKMLMSLYNVALRGTACVFFQNQANMLEFCKVRPVSRGKLLPGSGVNLEQHCYEAYPDEQDGLVLLSIGRMMRDKGTDELLWAARQVRSVYPSVRFILIGSFDDAEYEEKVHAAAADGIVEFVGQQDDVHGFIKNSHATIHASYHEGMSNVLLESAAAGRPVIATDVPGCRETYDDGVSGLSCRAKDAEDLARAIFEFIELPYERKADMGRAGRRKMENEFDRSIVVDQYLQEIEMITGAKENASLS